MSNNDWEKAIKCKSEANKLSQPYQWNREEKYNPSPKFEFLTNKYRNPENSYLNMKENSII